MKLYKLGNDILLESHGKFYRQDNTDWDQFVNDDNLYQKAATLVANSEPVEVHHSELHTHVDPPMHGQELWACGVTYIRSKVGRQEESKDAGGADFYARVYEADRPEIFFKAMRNRVKGSGQPLRIRKDSSWDVPEPELTLMVTSNGKIVGYTVGNDMSSRSIEGENPLYLPQAKCYDGCAGLGPCLLVTESPISSDTTISLSITRGDKEAFAGSIEINQISRPLESLVEYLYRECSFEHGALLMTGTGIVPGSDFTLQSGDVMAISIEGIGTLTNTVE